MRLRTVVWEDFAFIKELVTDDRIYTHIKKGEKWTDKKVIEFIEICIENPDSHFYIIEHEGCEVGVIGVVRKKKKFSMTVFIHPDHQSKKYFWKSFHLFRTELKRRKPNLYHFYVHTHQDNKKMNRIMSKHYACSDSFYIGKILVYEYKIILDPGK